MNPLRMYFGTILWLCVMPDVSGQAMADEPGPWTVTYELSAKSDVSINLKRLFHGPAALVAPNGDWLVCYQDSENHAGRDGVISQVRSRDEGRTWKSDGIVFDQRPQKYYGRNPAYGITSDGLIVLVVQRWRPPPPGSEIPAQGTEDPRQRLFDQRRSRQDVQ